MSIERRKGVEAVDVTEPGEALGSKEVDENAASEEADEEEGEPIRWRRQWRNGEEIMVRIGEVSVMLMTKASRNVSQNGRLCAQHQASTVYF